MNAKRTTEFKRNPYLEQLLTEINQLLTPVEEKLAAAYRMPQFPVVIIVGAPRCGSTIMMQWLAATACFAYPTNLLSRFYNCPAVGAKIQRLLTDPKYNFNDEILDFSQNKLSFTSNLGKTNGALAPNEFWYFWRRFIPNIEPEYLDKTSLGKIDGVKLCGELAALESVLEKPLALKGHILEFNLTFLASLLEKVLFVYIKREPVYNIQSLLEARKRYYGSVDAWYSVKPKEYEWLKNLTPVEQVAGQVYYTNHTIEQDLQIIDDAKSLAVSYESFCSSPITVFEQIKQKFSAQGCAVTWEYHGPAQFETTNQIRLSPQEVDEISNAYSKLSGQPIKM